MRWMPLIASVGGIFALAVLGIVTSSVFKHSLSANRQQIEGSIQDSQTQTQAPPTPDSSIDDLSVSAPSVPSLRLVRSLNELSQVWSVDTYVRGDGRVIVAGGNAEGDIKLWDAPIGKLERILIGHTDVVRTVAVAPSGNRLVSGSGDGIKVWNPQSGELLYSLPSDTGLPVWTVAISPDERTFISGDYDGAITVWDLESGQALYRRYVEMPVWKIAIAPDGESFISANDDGTLIQWNLDSGDIIKEFIGHTSTVRAAAITPDGKTLASGSWDTTIKLWDIESGELIGTLEEHSDRVVTLAISPDGQTLASGSVDRTLKTWDISAQTLIRTLDINTNWVLTVAFDPVEKTLISGGKDQDVKVWN